MASKPGGAAPRWAGSDRKAAQPHSKSSFCPQESEKVAAAGMAAPGAGAPQQQQQHAAGGGPGATGDESSDSEGEHEGPQKLIRKVSTSGQIRSKTSIKEGFLLKQTSSFQRWKRRYFKLRGRTLYYAKDSKSLIFDEVDLSDASVAESSTKNVNNSFTV
ncbi:hypothetical protein chiPu_0012517 [Chiloscyllium punctatum]|uniref:PH domain-containing protein n=1 Tax=Chiloscyllium punctatum TaxID=137246 RepID=A0A401SUF5_CHIPU|nr:hypothetical protein [Chiloscyllium punctatum]